jgi:hypothetical protein
MPPNKRAVADTARANRGGDVGEAQRRKLAGTYPFQQGHVDDQPEFFWVALQGCKAPHCGFSVSLSRMRQATVVLGENPDQQTLWDIDNILGAESNYDLLVGYPTAEEQRTVAHTFLDAPIEEDRAELQRMQRLGDGCL